MSRGKHTPNEFRIRRNEIYPESAYRTKQAFGANRNEVKRWVFLWKSTGVHNREKMSRLIFTRHYENGLYQLKGEGSVRYYARFVVEVVDRII